MVSNFTSEFTVSWHDPADAEHTWFYDRMHAPEPMMPAATEFWDRMYQRYMGCRVVAVNGYAFSTQPTPPPPTPEILERGVMDVWTNDYLPEIKSYCDRLRAEDYDGMALAQLGDAMDVIMSDAAHAFGFTMKPISGFMGPTFGFVGFLESELGLEAPQFAATMLQGSRTEPPPRALGLARLPTRRPFVPPLPMRSAAGNSTALSTSRADPHSSTGSGPISMSSVGASIAGASSRSPRGPRTRVCR